MPRPKTYLGAFAGILLLSGAISQMLGCSEGTAPTAPTSAAPKLTDPGLAGALSSSSITFVTDSNVNGSESQISGFDGTSLLTFNTSKGAFTARFDNNTVFRNAQLDKFSPVDPCRDAAAAYNAAGATVDTNGVFLAISAMASSGCIARIGTEKSVPPNPINPIKSFRPLAAF